MDNSSSRAEAERWLYTANKLLSARDLHGARSFAVRARESDPTFDASELLLTVIDTLLAGENRINSLHDWYGILQILPYTHNIEYIATHYRRLALLLDPQRNPFSFSSHAFTLVHDAWSVLSNPAKKAMYDNELRLVTGPPPAPPPPPAPAPVHALNPIPPPNPPPVQQQQHHHQQIQSRKSPRSKDGRAVTEDERPSLNIASNEPPRPARTTSEPVRDTEPPTEVGSSFWTACPYCYVMYEYPKAYEDCTLRCQSCRRGFHAMRVRSPPVEAKDSYYCCWGFFPLGFSGNFKDISGTNSKWNPFSAMFACPLKGGASNRRYNRGPWVYYDDEAAAAFVELSDTSEDDSDDDDWRGGNRRGKKKAKSAKGKSSVSAGGNARRGGSERGRRGSQSGSGHVNLDNGGVVDGGGGGGSGVPNAARAESSKKAAMNSSRRRAVGNLGKLDLNVEFSNEVEEPAPSGMREGNVAGNAEENIEGIAFFEGLDEFLSSLPILNVVADDKVKGH